VNWWGGGVSVPPVSSKLICFVVFDQRRDLIWPDALMQIAVQCGYNAVACPPFVEGR
jgi:hypothetical protein